MQVEVDGSRVDCFELVHTKEAAEIEDHKITVIGPEIDEIPVGSKISMSYTVDVAGKAMQPDFESVMERKFPSYLNFFSERVMKCSSSLQAAKAAKASRPAITFLRFILILVIVVVV